MQFCRVEKSLSNKCKHTSKYQPKPLIKLIENIELITQPYNLNIMLLV